MTAEDESGDDLPRLRLELPAVHSACRGARELLAQFAETHGMSEEHASPLILVADELLSNAVDHGGGDSARDLEESSTHAHMLLELRLGRGLWRIAVSDEGGGRVEDLQDQLSGEFELDAFDERGRGFFLVQAMADGIEVDQSTDGKGLRVTAWCQYETLESDADQGEHGPSASSH